MSVFNEEIVWKLQSANPDRCYAFLTMIDSCAENSDMTAFDVRQVVEDYIAEFIAQHTLQFEKYLEI